MLIHYEVYTPFTGTMNEEEKGISLFPIKFSTTQHNNAYRLNNAPILEAPHVQEIRAALFDRKAVHEDIVEMGKLLGRFLSDFNVKDQKQISIVTFYQDDSSDSDFADGSAEKRGREAETSEEKSSKAFSLNQYFSRFFQLVGTLDPIDLWVAAELFIIVPVVGRVKVTSIRGSLLKKGASVTANIDVVLAKGTAILTAPSNSNGTHDLMIEASAEIKIVGTATTGGRIKLVTLPSTGSESLKSVRDWQVELPAPKCVQSFTSIYYPDEEWDDEAEDYG
ncbi:hypothetical protein C8J56DRAFT_883565 [Mycena floridula]|nr:hypothetical protein C8J56DRAFT_883565 [Mycena floridula]